MKRGFEDSSPNMNYHNNRFRGAVWCAPAKAHTQFNEKLTVRETENIVRDWKSATGRSTSGGRTKRSAEVVSLENELQSLIGAKVFLHSRGKKGKIVIHFYSLDELDRILRLLRSKNKGKTK